MDESFDSRIPLIWYGGREKWDQDIVEVLAPPDRYRYQTPDEPTDGAVVVIPGGAYSEKLSELNGYLEKLSWTVVMLTSDEESLLPWWNLHHPNMRVWVQYPRPDKHKNPSLRLFPIGYPLQGWDKFNAHHYAVREPDLTWFFRGQINHIQRDEMLHAMKKVDRGYGEATGGFARGGRWDYLNNLIHCTIAPSPSGPASADSFRCWEALEAGAIPIVDDGPKRDPEGRAITNYPSGFWELLLGGGPVFPVIHSWEEAPALASDLLKEFPVAGNRVFSWWQRYKWELRQKLYEDVEEVMSNTGDIRSLPSPVTSVGRSVTVLIPTSPTPNNPDFSHLDETIESVRDQLPDATIFLMLDGVREEQEHLRAGYEEYQRRVLWMCNRHWGAVPFRFEEHEHQARMTRKVLQDVRTPFILFVEHDAPLTGEIPWGRCVQLLDSHVYDVIRFYHETILQEEHKYLMLDKHEDFLGTVQWSQRPHLAMTGYYRRILDDHFTSDEKHMIEDRMHSVAQDWVELHHLAIYAPEGNIQRSYHLDARGKEPKWVDS